MFQSNKQHLQPGEYSLNQFLAMGTILFLIVLSKLMPYLLPKFGWEIPVDQSWSYFWNFSPMLPLAVVTGATLSLRRAVLLTTVTYLAGDLGIWLVTGHRDWAFFPTSPFIYLAVWLIVFTGTAGARWMNDQDLLLRSLRNLISGFVGATLFFLITNFAVWALGSGATYPHNLGGLSECYTMAVPFYRNSLFAMAIYVPLLTALFQMIVPSSEKISVVELGQTPPT